MGFINYGGSVKIYGTDMACVQLCRIRKNRCKCSMCNKELPKGSVVLSKSYLKFCLDCYPKLFEKIRQEFKIFEGLMKQTEADLEINMEKYRTQNLASSI